MSREFVIRKHAERDIQAVFRWYEKQEPGLGEEGKATTTFVQD